MQHTVCFIVRANKFTEGLTPIQSAVPSAVVISEEQNEKQNTQQRDTSMYRSSDMSPANKFELIKKVPNCLGKYNFKTEDDRNKTVIRFGSEVNSV